MYVIWVSSFQLRFAEWVLRRPLDVPRNIIPPTLKTSIVSNSCALHWKTIQSHDDSWESSTCPQNDYPWLCYKSPPGLHLRSHLGGVIPHFCIRGSLTRTYNESGGVNSVCSTVLTPLTESWWLGSSTFEMTLVPDSTLFSSIFN